jgi:mitochondrial-processing peptidase subunit alpha
VDNTRIGKLTRLLTQLTSACMRKVSCGRALRRSPRPRHASTLPLNLSVRVTTLPNKIRVATENTPGHFSSVGLYIDAGARYETPSNSGVSHFLDRMAFKVHIRCSKRGYNSLTLLQSTQSMSDSDMVMAMSALGG